MADTAHSIPIAIPVTGIAMARELAMVGSPDGIWPDENHGVYGRIMDLDGELVLDLRVWYEPKMDHGRWTNKSLTISARHLNELGRMINSAKRFVADHETKAKSSKPLPKPRPKPRPKGRRVA